MNHRLRPAALITAGGKRFLIDTGPDLRVQMLKFGVDNLDGVLLTHTHFDHIAGLDDLRGFYVLHKKQLPCLVSKETLKEIRDRFPYMFLSKKADYDVFTGSRFDFCVLPADFGTIEFVGETWGYLSYGQAGMKVTGFRLGKLAYVLDVCDYTDEVFSHLQGLDLLVLSALRKTASPVHLTFEQAAKFAEKTGARRVIFSHIAHDADHEESSRGLPPNITIAYDGLEVAFDPH
jgi:phosphoribosyl 1,2-cyclic phosphate phosphodiesterase